MLRIFMVVSLFFSILSFVNGSEGDSKTMTPEEQCLADGYFWEDGICYPPPSETSTDDISNYDGDTAYSDNLNSNSN